jgi:uncharacterized membrane protein HdeD (DUF308 family)
MKNKTDMITELKQAQRQTLAYMQNHWRLFFAEGVFFILLGVAAIVIPQVFSVVIVIFLGWLIALGGAFQISRALFIRNMPGFWLWLGSGILQVLVGILLIADPIAGVLTLTMMMALFFGLEGIIKIILAFMIRPTEQWQFILFSGMTALFFAGIILAFWTETEHWLLGLFMGINMIILGWSMVKMSLYHKDSHS